MWLRLTEKKMNSFRKSVRPTTVRIAVLSVGGSLELYDRQLASGSHGATVNYVA